MAEQLQVLKDGYWDRTTVVRTTDGSLRVRKESKLTDQPGPWAHAALRNEIQYLRDLTGDAGRYFPPLLRCWDDETIGYEIPYYEDRRNVSQLLLSGTIDQKTANAVQRELAEAIFEHLHPSSPSPSAAEAFPRHLVEVLTNAIETLGDEERFQQVTESETVRLNGVLWPGLRHSLARLGECGALQRIARTPTVRLHGDLFLENILWSPLLLIDPVSVAGLTEGPPLFDLLKYESYARGELFAIREEILTAGPASAGFVFEIDWNDSRLSPFQRLDLSKIFHQAFIRHYGPVDPQEMALLDAYFSLVMARNTTGIHQWGRVLKATRDLAVAVATKG